MARALSPPWNAIINIRKHGRKTPAKKCPRATQHLYLIRKCAGISESASTIRHGHQSRNYKLILTFLTANSKSVTPDHFSGDRGAILYSLIESCRRRGLDP